MEEITSLSTPMRKPSRDTVRFWNTEFRPLYNGNISSMVSTNRIFDNPAVYNDSATLFFNYRYDQAEPDYGNGSVQQV